MEDVKVFTLQLCVETTETHLEAIQEFLLLHPSIHSVTYIDEAAAAEVSDGKES